MTAARRESLQTIAMPALAANAGLELDRYLAEAVGGESKARGNLIARVCAAPPPDIYRAAYERWTAMLDGWLPEIARGEYAVADRLIIGLGAASVRETGLTLQHVYGVPVIPGSALKGLARRYARLALDADPADAAVADLARQQLETLVGSPDSAAFLSFFDAWYVPGSAPDDRPLQPDVITVHHPQYYGSRGGTGYGPWDFDDPTPIPFVREAGNYLVAVRGPDAGWAAFGLATLEYALAEWGIGAKTSSGYGRLRKIDQAAGAAAKLAAEMAADITALSEPSAADLRALYTRCREQLPEEWQLAPIQAIVAHLRTPRLQGYLNHPWARAAVARANHGQPGNG